jgi:hypothetical protein
MDDFKRHIEGYRRNGRTCPCCRETDVISSRRLARRRMKQADRREAGVVDPAGDE